VIVEGIVLIVGFDWLATDAVKEIKDWIKSDLNKGR
jgi:hypothetical protein